MSVWYCIPSARPSAEANACLRKWRERGYAVAVQRDPGNDVSGVDADIVYRRPYAGYAESVNWLARSILAREPSCRIIVTGGDDIDPDPSHDPAVLEREFLEHFGGSFGVCQSTGDRWMVDAQGRSSEERVCCSPWMGREFCERINGGSGPIWHQYRHMFEDEELHEVATRLGILWHRPDVCQYHHHWIRQPNPQRPPHLTEAKEDWANSKRLFDERKAAGFPGHEPLPALVTA